MRRADSEMARFLLAALGRNNERMAGDMNAWQSMVREFQKTFNQPVGTTPALLDPDRWLIRRDWEESERIEGCNAFGDYDLPNDADAIVDEIYLLIGRANEMGIDLDPLFRAVHAANMAKVGGGSREDGKILKPAGWQAPDIASELVKQGWKP
jgi:hypothetical protein